MEKDEARRIVVQINSLAGDIRQLLYRLKNEDGWRSLGYKSWRECVTEEFQFGPSYIYRLLKAEEVQRSLPPCAPVVKESVARELCKLPRSEIASAYAAAEKRESGRDSPRAKTVRAVVSERLSSAARKPESSADNRVRQEIEDGKRAIGNIVDGLRSVVKEIRRVGESTTGIWIKASAVEADLRRIIEHISLAAPYAPCPYSHAAGLEGCRACRGMGWVTLMVWNATDESLKRGAI